MRLGYDTDLLTAVCEKLARAVMQRHGLASVAPLHAGAMSVMQ